VRQLTVTDASREAAKAKIALSGGPGWGKAQPLDARVLTPTGWTTMGDIQVGSRVTTRDGGSATVTGIYPQGTQPIYRVTFTDGSSTECTGDHLWLTQGKRDRAAQRSGTVRTLRQIMERGLRSSDGRYRHYVPMVEPVEFEEGPLPLDPWLLGALLGDGCLRERCALFSTVDQEMWDRVAELLPVGVELRKVSGDPNSRHLRCCASSGPNPLVDILRELGLGGKRRAAEKHVPALYLYASAKSRLALLQGLLDTDGYTDGVKVEYTTASPQLARDVRFLVQSLGGRVYTATRTPGYTHKGERRNGALSYRMSIRLPGHVEPFRLTRKRDSYRPRTKYQPARAIKAIEYVGDKPAQCIRVDHPERLYVTDDFIITHNTRTALSVARVLSPDGTVMVIDTEHESARLYAPPPGHEPGPGEFRFKHTAWTPPYSVRELTETIQQYAKHVDVLVIDSLSHFWQGEGGVLDMAAGKFTGWKDARPAHRAMVDAIVRAPCHLIGCMRSKVEYAQEQDAKGKQVVRRLGMADVQDDSIAYEFTVTAELDAQHRLTVTKTRCRDLALGQVFAPDHETDMAAVLLAWLEGPAAERAADGERSGAGAPGEGGVASADPAQERGALPAGPAVDLHGLKPAHALSVLRHAGFAVASVKDVLALAGDDARRASEQCAEAAEQAAAERRAG